MDGLTEFPLPNGNGDRGFVTTAGMKFRVRLRRTDSDFAKPAAGIDPTLTLPTKMTLSLSLSLLDADDNVETVEGKLRIFDRHEILVSDDNLANPAFNLQDVIEAAIMSNIASAEAIVTNQATAVTYLTSSWGIDTLSDTITPIPQTLEEVKEARKLEVETLRDTTMNGGCPCTIGMIDSDEKSRLYVAGAVSMAQIAIAQSQPFAMRWRKLDNTYSDLDAQSMISMGVELGMFVNDCCQTSFDLKDAIEACLTVEEVAAIDIATPFAAIVNPV